MRMTVEHEFYGSKAYPLNNIDLLGDEYRCGEFYCYTDIHVFQKVIDALDDNKIIDAIKIHRAATGAGLKDSKNYIESITYMYVVKMMDSIKILRKTNPEYFI